MNHGVDETTAEGEGFNFNQWLIDNDLVTMKELFIKHGATIATKLQISSPEMQRLLVDPEFLSQPQMVPKLVMATHHLDMVEKIVTVVLSEKEQAVIDHIKRELEAVDQKSEEVNRLKVEYPKSQERFNKVVKKRIEIVTAQINERFDTLFAALEKRKQDWLKQLDEITREYGYEADRKDIEEALNQWAQYFTDLRTSLKDKDSKYNDLISAKMDNVERKKSIMQIGQDVEEMVQQQQKQYNECTQIVKDIDAMIQDNNMGFIMHFTMESGIETRIGNIQTLRTISEPLAITMEVDPMTEEQVFEHHPVRAWRYDTEQNKWRGRGKGRVQIYWNKQAQLGLLRFTDKRHNKIRLLQWINGDGPCEYCADVTAFDDNDEETELNKEELEWFGADYTMDQQNPMIGKWKMHFIENEDAASHFIAVFNKHLDEAKVIHEMDADNGHNDGDDDDGNVMTFGVNDNIQDPPEINISEDDTQSQDDQKQFAFDYKGEARVENPFSSKMADGYGDNVSATNWMATNWTLGGGDTTIATFDTNTSGATQQPIGDINAEANTNGARNNNDEENKENAETAGEERYKGQNQYEIDLDKVRGAKAAKDAQSAKLSQSNDADASQTVSWSFNAFGGREISFDG